MMYLIVRTALDGGTVYWYTSQELNAFVQACTVAYDYADEIESPTERLLFYRALKEAVNVEPEPRLVALRAALNLYTQYHGGTEIEIIPVDDYCKQLVLSPDISEDIDRMIEGCMTPAAEETLQIQQLQSLEAEMDRQAAMQEGEIVIEVNPLLSTGNQQP